MKYIRHGDVLLRRINKAQAAKLRNRGLIEKPNATLAEGEVTGHSHRVVGEGVKVFDVSDAPAAMPIRGAQVSASEMLLSISAKTALLTHEEHGDIALPKGDYLVMIQREYDGEVIRQVID